MKYLLKTLSLIIGLGLLGCGTQVTTFKPNNKDLSTYKTFAYLPNSNEVANKSYDDDEVSRLVIETINKHMTEQGYTIDQDEPDLLVLVSTKTETKTDITQEPVYVTYPYRNQVTQIRPYYHSYYYKGYDYYTKIIGYDTDTYQYQEGTLIIDIVDRKTEKTVWKGITSDNIYSGSTTKAIADLVEEIFEEYPLKK